MEDRINTQQKKGNQTPFSTFHIPHTTYYSRGFTLIELIVTVSIFALISSVVLVRNSQFDNEVLLAGVAYDVALSIRQAQNYGINVLGQGNQFDHPYGVYFEPGATTYVLFRDTDGKYAYEAGEELETFTLGRKFSIARVCELSSRGTCTESLLNSATILFKRPNPDAIINADEKGENALGGVGIELVTSRGGSRFIIVRTTGQIEIVHLEEAVGGGDGGGVIGI